jgi:hypothetical protein
MITRFCSQSRVCLLSNSYCQQLLRFQSNERQTLEDLEEGDEFRKLQIFPTKKSERIERKRYLSEVMTKTLIINNILINNLLKINLMIR